MYLCAINLYIIVGVYVCGREEESGRERTERERKRERKRERERERGYVTTCLRICCDALN